jgi:hypothetical protein
MRMISLTWEGARVGAFLAIAAILHASMVKGGIRQGEPPIIGEGGELNIEAFVNVPTEILLAAKVSTLIIYQIVDQTIQKVSGTDVIYVTLAVQEFASIVIIAKASMRISDFRAWLWANSDVEVGIKVRSDSRIDIA